MSPPDRLSGSSRARIVLVSIVLVVLGVLIQLPWLDAPFGPDMVNPAAYFGPFARSFRAFGFDTLRGVPLTVSPYQQPREGLIYLSHPPGTAWILGLGGGAEWTLRLPTAIGVALAALTLFHLLRSQVGDRRAFVAALFLLILPVLAVFSQGSYEGLVLPAGLLTLLAAERVTSGAGKGRALWGLVLILISLVGPWLDWAYGWFTAALFILCARRPAGRHLLCALFSSVAAVASVIGTLLWKAWALQAPALGGRKPGSLEAALQEVVLDRPPLGDFLHALLERLTQGFTWPVVILGLVGALVALKRHPRITLALLTAGILNPVVMAKHTMGHVFYLAYLAPFVVLGLVSLPLPGKGIARAAAALLLALSFAACSVRTAEAMRAGSDPFYRDLGGVLDEWSAQREGERIVRVYRVLTNVPQLYPLYFETPLFAQVMDRTGVESVLREGGPAGVRYLHLRIEDERGPILPEAPDLLPFLRRFPSRRIPLLERRIERPLDGAVYRVTRAEIFFLRP